MAQDDVIYEASAIAEGQKSEISRFVQNRSENSAEAAKRGLRSEARVLFPSEFRADEEIELIDIDIQKLDAETSEPL